MFLHFWNQLIQPVSLTPVNPISEPKKFSAPKGRLGRPIFQKCFQINFDGPISWALTYSKMFGEKNLVQKVVFGTPRRPF